MICFKNEPFVLTTSLSVQGCSCCDGNSEGAAEVVDNQPDLEIVDAATWSVGCQWGPREDPTNAAVIFCHVASAASNTKTQPARQ